MTVITMAWYVLRGYQFGCRYGRQEGFLTRLIAVELLQMQKPSGRSSSMPQNEGRTYANTFFFRPNAKIYTSLSATCT